MKLRNELQTITVDDRAGRHVEGVVRVRGMDARVAAGGLVIEQRLPVALDVREGADVRRIPIPRPEPYNLALAFAAAPLASFLLTRMLRKRRT